MILTIYVILVLLHVVVKCIVSIALCHRYTVMCVHTVNKTVGRILLEFEDVEYFTPDNIVAADDSSQSSNEAFMVKMESTRF